LNKSILNNQYAAIVYKKNIKSLDSHNFLYYAKPYSFWLNSPYLSGDELVLDSKKLYVMKNYDSKSNFMSRSTYDVMEINDHLSLEIKEPKNFKAQERSLYLMFNSFCGDFSYKREVKMIDVIGFDGKPWYILWYIIGSVWIGICIGLALFLIFKN